MEIITINQVFCVPISPHNYDYKKPAIGDGVLWTTCKRKAQPEAQLGSREAKAVSLGGSVVARHSQEGTYVA